MRDAGVAVLATQQRVEQQQLSLQAICGTLTDAQRSRYARFRCLETLLALCS